MSLISKIVLSGMISSGFLAVVTCTSSNGTTGPTFVTELALQDSAGTGRQAFAVGETVRLVMTVRNRTQQVIEVQLPGWCGESEFMIAPSRTSTPLWKLSSNIACIQTVTRTLFAPLETKTFRVDWNQRDDVGQQVAVGDYEAFATMADRLFPGQPGSRPSELSSTLRLFTIN